MKSGTLELDAPPGDFEQAIQRTKELADTLQLGGRMMGSAPSKAADVDTQTEIPGSSRSREKSRAGGAKTSSAGRPGRLGSFEPIRDLLTEAQHKEIYAYMQEKAPSDQEDQILVAVHKGEQLLGRQGFTYNEIYTLLWRAGIEPLPKAIDVVVQRLIQTQRMDKGDSGYFMKFLGQSRVDKELPLSTRDAA